MPRPLTLLAALVIAVAVAIVFSPLAGAFAATGVTRHTVAFDGVALPTARSTGMAAVAAAVALLLGVPFAVCVERTRGPARRLCWAVGLAALVVPPYVVAEAWIVLLGPAGRVARPVALLLGFGPGRSDRLAVVRYTVAPWVYSWPAAGGVMGGCLFPIVALATAAAWRRADGRTFEAARLMRGRRGVAAVATRTLLPPAAGGAMLVFAATLTEFAVPQLLRFRGVGELVYERVQTGDLAAAAAVVVPTLPLVLLAGVAGAVVLRRSRSAGLAGLEGDVPRPAPPFGGIGTVVSVAVAVVAIIPAVVIPAVSLAWLAASAARPVGTGGTHRVTRAAGFADALRGAWELAGDDAVRTVGLATVAATVATAFAVVAARLAPRVRWGPPVLGSLAAGLAVPAPIVGLGLIAVWDRGAASAVYESVAVVFLAWLARFLPLVVLLVRAALARVPRELEEAAALAGRGPAARLFGVVVRSAAPGLAVAWAAMYVLCAGEFNATVLVAPPGQPLLAPSVVNLMRRAPDPQVAACQVLLLGVVGLPLASGAVALTFATWRVGRRAR